MKLKKNFIVLLPQRPMSANELKNMLWDENSNISKIYRLDYLSNTLFEKMKHEGEVIRLLDKEGSLFYSTGLTLLDDFKRSNNEKGYAVCFEFSNQDEIDLKFFNGEIPLDSKCRIRMMTGA